MDGTRFDDLTRALGAGTSRRRVLRSLAGGAVASLAGVWGARGAEARGIDEACFADGECDSGICSRPRGRRRGKCAARAPRACAVEGTEFVCNDAEARTVCGFGSGSVGDCYCGLTAEGTPACLEEASCPDFDNGCAGSEECLPGFVCSADHCCGGGGSEICLLLCQNPVA